ncbi:PAS domain-containing protein [Enterococcus sp. HY326]|uniref:PAS domain-containing protein n=1 Tax=Enterococcus sp. HY326 TaxID=2971265 RepID=UPI00223FD6A8|nr:PAS domain-containing protein [Enterococcus sp. HY326]
MSSIELETGKLTIDQLNGIFKVIPQEFDFIDENDIVRWYSNNSMRLFDRDKSALNKHVLDVHPGKSSSRITKLLEQMHSGEISQQIMVIPAKGKQIQISFFSVRDSENNYIGCIEVTQDVSHLVGKSKIGHFFNLIKKGFK